MARGARAVNSIYKNIVIILQLVVAVRLTGTAPSAFRCRPRRDRSSLRAGFPQSAHTLESRMRMSCRARSRFCGRAGVRREAQGHPNCGRGAGEPSADAAQPQRPPNRDFASRAAAPGPLARAPSGSSTVRYRSSLRIESGLPHAVRAGDRQNWVYRVGSIHDSSVSLQTTPEHEFAFPATN